MSTNRMILHILLLSLFPFLHASADWNNFIINYNKNIYGKGSQTWEIASYNENWVYFANQNGMLQYDGNEWSKFTLNNLSDIRSILPSQGQKRIFVGGINEFGYFYAGVSGELIYTCMSDSLEESERNIGNIWGIYENDNIMYILGDSRILKFLNNKYTTINTGRKIDCSGLVNGILYVGTDNGVFMLIGNTFFPIQDGDILMDKRIRGIIPHENGILIITAYNGMYYNNGKETVTYNTPVDDFLRKNEVFSVAYSGNHIALGTVHKGIVLIDRQSTTIKYFNENNGLQNNTVLSLSFDPRGNLWAGLDSGIDYVCLNSPLTNLYTYPHSFGTGYAAILKDDYLYLGTNRGLYYTQYPVKIDEDRPDISTVPNSSGQVWNLSKVNDELFCLHDRGIFLLDGISMKRIGNIHGAWKCELVVGETDKMYVGVYDGIYLLEKLPGLGWVVSHKIEGISDSFRFFEQESAQVLWVTDPTRVMRVELDINLTRVIKRTILGVEEGLRTTTGIHSSRVDGRVYFSTPEGIYRFNPHTNKMEISQEMNNMFHTAGPYYKIVDFHDHLIGINNREICISNKVTYKKGSSTYVLPLDMPAVELVQGAETIIPLSDSLMIVPNDNGFALARIPVRRTHEDYSRSVHILNAFISYPRDSLIYSDNYLGRKAIPEIPYSQNSLRLEYGITSFTHGEDVSFQYRLDKDVWSDLTKTLVKEYSNLSEGVHTFEIKALFTDAMSATDIFTFRILPPWYRTNIAYAFYIFLILASLFAIYRWDDTRVKRKQQRAVVEKDKELKKKEREFEEEYARKERQIIQLEKEKLEHDLQYKSQEMANLMINSVRKNEMFTEIKSDIFKVMSTLKGENTRETKQMLLVVNNKIDSNIQSDDVLKKVEEQFDLVHNNFMKRLQEKHPDLSFNERMMCAYLKMNLSTKEIAPLLNISVRGVETIRYRIRKKFGFGREDNLTEYLNNKL